MLLSLSAQYILAKQGQMSIYLLPAFIRCGAGIMGWEGIGGFGAVSQPLARSLHWTGPALGHRFVPLVLGFPALLGEECHVHVDF